MSSKAAKTDDTATPAEDKHTDAAAEAKVDKQAAEADAAMAAAFAEDAATGTDTESDDTTGENPETSAADRNAGESVFQPFGSDSGASQARDLEMVMDIPVSLSVELGRTRLTIKQLLELAQGSVVKLDGLPGEPMDILINGYLIAQGEVVVVEEKFGIRVTEIVTPSERLQRLNR